MQDKKSIEAFALWCWRRLLKLPWTAKKTNQEIFNQINPEFLLEAQMTRIKLCRRPSNLEKALGLRKTERGEKRMDSVTVTITMSSLWEDLKDQVRNKSMRSLGVKKNHSRAHNQLVELNY